MKNKNSGFTLAEVLVAIVIGVISIAAAFSSYGYFNKSYKSVSQKAAINNSAREALSIITKDLRNTGYLHVDFTEEPNPSWRLIELIQKELGQINLFFIKVLYQILGLEQFIHQKNIVHANLLLNGAISTVMENI